MPARSDLRADGMAVCAAILTLVLPSLALAGGGASLCLTETRGQGREIARYPLGQDQAFSLSFIHSVSRTPVTDIYRIEAGERSISFDEAVAFVNANEPRGEYAVVIAPAGDDAAEVSDGMIADELRSRVSAGISKRNAVDEVKARANVVIGDNESASIAEFIYRQLL